MEQEEIILILNDLKAMNYNQWLAVRKIMDLKFKVALNSVKVEFSQTEDSLFIENIIGMTLET